MPSSRLSPHALLRETLPPLGDRKAGQISPGKNKILPCTTAAFTISHVLQMGFVMLCSLTQGFGLVCSFCPSAHRFALQLLSAGRSPFRALLSASTFKGVTMTSSQIRYRGLAPHKIMPMPGTHKALVRTQTTLRFVCAAQLNRYVSFGSNSVIRHMTRSIRPDLNYYS